jgi:hypothetical protein
VKGKGFILDSTICCSIMEEAHSPEPSVLCYEGSQRADIGGTLYSTLDDILLARTVEA